MPFNCHHTRFTLLFLNMRKACRLFELYWLNLKKKKGPSDVIGGFWPRLYLFDLIFNCFNSKGFLVIVLD